MNIYKQFEDLFGDDPRGVAKVTGQRTGGKVIAQTPSGTEILLIGTMATGKTVYYNQRTHAIISEAPAVNYSEMGV